MRSELLAAIGGHLAYNPGDPFVTALGGADALRYWPWEAGQFEPYPYAVSFIVSEADAGAILTGVTAFEWQMNIYAESLTCANALAGQCKSLFGNAGLVSPSGCSFTCAYEATYGPMRAAIEDPFQITVTFSCYL